MSSALADARLPYIFQKQLSIPEGTVLLQMMILQKAHVPCSMMVKD